jgi:hypothetical protein
VKRYHLHVATDNKGMGAPALRANLSELGLVDDQLVHQGLVFNAHTASFYTSCPLIDVHMSIDVNDPSTLRAIESRAVGLLAESGCAGYWHSEVVEWDASVTPGVELDLSFAPPFGILQPEPRTTHKKWDLHIAFLDADLPQPLRERLIEYGLYYLVRRKLRGEVAVLTVQGINPIQEGRRFAQALLWWLVRIGAPPFDFKFEVTVKMGTVNDPQLVPPTIDHVVWR